MSNNLEILLVGTGSMAVDYQKVLESKKINYLVVGRGIESCNSFYNLTSVKPNSGGIKDYLSSNPNTPSHAIISVGILDLKEVALSLLHFGIKNILIEKPGGLNETELNQVYKISQQKNANVYIAYNRRFYASTYKAIEFIKKDGGVLSFNFEFTEWSKIIESSNIPEKILQNYFFANSSHVVDLAFYLGGKPKKINSFVTDSTSWHNRGAIFVGSGIPNLNALFSYQANWKSPGRWAVELLTQNHRLIFKPMEKLQIQRLNYIDINYVNNIDYSLDEKYKPGLYKQVECFINCQDQKDQIEYKKLCTIKDQLDNYRNYYRKIANY